MVYSMRPMPSHLCAESPNRYLTPANKEASKQVTAKVSALTKESAYTLLSDVCDDMRNDQLQLQAVAEACGRLCCCA